MIAASIVALLFGVHTVSATAAPAPRSTSPLHSSPRPSTPASSSSRPTASAHRHPTWTGLDTLLTRYAAQLAATPTPETMTFELTVDQVGQRNLSQRHLIYRSGLLLRDETIGVGTTAVRPRIRLFRNRPDSYALERIAPTPTMYRFTVIGLRRSDTGDDEVVLQATPRRLIHTGFVITRLAISLRDALPTELLFRASGPAMNASGRLRYGRVERGWLILSAEATMQQGSHQLREHLTFEEYHFPQSLPAAAFGGGTP